MLNNGYRLQSLLQKRPLLRILSCHRGISRLLSVAAGTANHGRGVDQRSLDRNAVMYEGTVELRSSSGSDYYAGRRAHETSLAAIKA